MVVYLCSLQTLVKRTCLFAAAGLWLVAVALPIAAQNTAGVFGPNITPNSEALEWRLSVAPGSDGRSDRVASRLHYQSTVTDDLRLRAVLQGADELAADSDFDFDFFQFEAQWQFRHAETSGWDSALRLDLQLAEGRADLLGLNWTSDFQLGGPWRARTVLLTGVQLGPQRRDGLFLQTRASLGYTISGSTQLQLQSFNIYGTTDGFGDFSDQNHAFGPAVSGKFAGRWSYEAGLLFGLTNATADTDFRLFISRSF